MGSGFGATSARKPGEVCSTSRREYRPIEFRRYTTTVIAMPSESSCEYSNLITPALLQKYLATVPFWWRHEASKSRVCEKRSFEFSIERSHCRRDSSPLIPPPPFLFLLSNCSITKWVLVRFHAAIISTYWNQLSKTRQLRRGLSTS